MYTKTGLAHLPIFLCKQQALTHGIMSAKKHTPTCRGQLEQTGADRQTGGICSDTDRLRRDGRTDRQTDRRTDRQTNRIGLPQCTKIAGTDQRMDEPTNGRQTDRQTDRRTDEYTHALNLPTFPSEQFFQVPLASPKPRGTPTALGFTKSRCKEGKNALHNKSRIGVMWCR